MTTVRITPGRGWTHTPTVGRTYGQHVLLACGVLSSMLYIATDVVGGLMYDGYSFTSQAVSELMAVGAPSERIVDPLFLVYDVLVVAFGVALFREGAGRNLALRITGCLLAAYGLLGFSGPTLFEMNQRGMGHPGSDTAHIVVTGVLVLLLLAAIGVGGFAFGRTFRIYSLITLLLVIVFGVLTIPFGVRIAAGQPTPGFGILERVNIYLSLLWIAVAGAALLQDRSPHGQETP